MRVDSQVIGSLCVAFKIYVQGIFMLRTLVFSVGQVRSSTEASRHSIPDLSGVMYCVYQVLFIVLC